MAGQNGVSDAVDSAVAPSLRALEPRWCERELRSRGFPGVSVTEVRSESMAVTGAVGDIARVRLWYAAGSPAGPASAIAKIRAADEQRSAIDAAMHLYERESRFYTGFSDRVRLRSPRCLGVGDGSTTPLLLEDLAYLRAGDQVAGLAVADAERVIDALADQHAAFWNSPVCQEPWLVSPTEPALAGAIAHMVGSGVPVLRERYADRAPSGAINAVERLAPRWLDVLHACAEGARTVIHNDCRLDNLFFEADGTPIFVDWQMIGVSRGTQDVGNLLAGSMGLDDLRQHWERLLRRYHDRLGEHGVRDYTWQECVSHYRQTILYPLGQGIALIGALAQADGRGLADAALLRALTHCHDLHSFDTVAAA